MQNPTTTTKKTGFLCGNWAPRDPSSSLALGLVAAQEALPLRVRPAGKDLLAELFRVYASGFLGVCHASGWDHRGLVTA